MLREEESRVRTGAPERDLDSYSEWRNEIDDAIIEAIYLYGVYLSGQADGFSGSLSLLEIMAMFELEQIEKEDRPFMTELILDIHHNALELATREAKQERRKNGNR